MAATTLYQGNAGVMDTKAYALLYDKTFDEVRMIQEKVPKQGLQFVSEESTISESYIVGETSSVLNLPYISQDTEKIRYLTPVRGHELTTTIYQRRAGIIVTKTAVETQQHKMILSMMKGLPASADRVVEYLIASLFTGAFATTAGADGSYFCAADHTKEDPQAGTWSNTATAALTSGSFFTAWQNLQNRTNEKGFVDFYDVDKLVYPVNLHEKALQILRSGYVPENATNAINPWQDTATPVKYNYLTSNYWFLHGKRPGDGQGDEGLMLIWRVRPEYATVSDSTNPELVYGKRLRMACAVACLHGRNWYGSTGAA